MMSVVVVTEEKKFATGKKVDDCSQEKSCTHVVVTSDNNKQIKDNLPSTKGISVGSRNWISVIKLMIICYYFIGRQCYVIF